MHRSRPSGGRRSTPPLSLLRSARELPGTAAVLALLLVELVSAPEPGAAQEGHRRSGEGEGTPAVERELASTSLGDEWSPPENLLEDAVLEGVVRGTLGGKSGPLAHAWITVDGRASGEFAVTDARGRYLLEAVEPGLRRIEVTRIGYRPHAIEIIVPPGGTIAVDVELEGAPVLVEGVTVRGIGEGGRGPVLPETTNRGRVEAIVRSLEFARRGGGGGLSAARELASDAPAGEGGSLLVRGRDPDAKEVFLDGIPIYTPFHLGGLLPTLDPELIDEVESHAGAAPAPVAGGLSRTTHLASRRPLGDQVRVRAAVDPVTARASVEGPLGDRIAALASYRGLHGSGGRLVEEIALPYGYDEGLVRLEADAGARGRIGITGFWNRETVAVDLPVTPSLDPPALEDRVGDEASWGNTALSLRYRRSLGKGSLRAVLAGNRYDAALPLGTDRPVWARGRTDRFRGQVEVRLPLAEGWRIGGGVGGEELRHRSSARTVVREVSPSSVAEASQSSEEINSVQSSAGGRVSGGFVELEGPLASDLRLRAGLRADHLSGAIGMRISPRASVTWTFGDGSLVRAALGRHVHFVQPTDVEARIATGDPAGLQAGQTLHPVATADHLVVGLEQAVTSRVHLEIDGHAKSFQGLPHTAGERLNASGLDIRLTRGTSRSRAWLGYSLSWFWSPDAGDGTAEGEESAYFRGRQTLSAGGERHLWNVFFGSVDLVYGDGLPLSSIPLFSDADGLRAVGGGGGGPGAVSGGEGGVPTLDGFLRIDVEIRAELEGTVGSREVRLRPYVRVANALDRRDALFFHFEPFRDPDARPLSQRTALPLAGIAVIF